MADKIRMDINSDIGESFGIFKLGMDEAVIPNLTSANIACGFHAGDPGVMKETVALAKRLGVEVGAHPGFPDLMGFGRRNMAASLDEIQDYVLYQVGALQAFATAEGTAIQHVKPHGALYNMAVADGRIWEAIARGLAKLNRDIILVVLAPLNREPLLDMADRCGIRIAFEAFADRAYKRDGSLAPRVQKNAVIHDETLAAERALKLAMERRITADDGTEIEIQADTLCVHGDNPAAVQMVKKIRETLQTSGVEVTAMKNFV
jgi:5-oxoprolinase (ATP-hydrolysing) subunit A